MDFMTTVFQLLFAVTALMCIAFIPFALMMLVARGFFRTTKKTVNYFHK